MSPTMDPPRNPRTPEEWQEAVDAAHALLHVDSAQAYGLVMGGPEVNVERCEAILGLGRELGYAPADDSVERYVREMMR